LRRPEGFFAPQPALFGSTSAKTFRFGAPPRRDAYIGYRIVAPCGGSCRSSPIKASAPSLLAREINMPASEIVIASAKRTAVGSFNGAFGSTPAHDLGAVAIKGALEAAKVDPSEVDEVIPRRG